MKNTMRIMLALMAGAVVAISCNKEMEFDENPIVEEPILSFLAGTEGDATKTFIDGFKVKWSANDAIAILDGTHAGKYTLTTGAGTTSGVFEFANEGGAVTEQTVYAVYPYAPSIDITVTRQDIIDYLMVTYGFGQEVCEKYLDDELYIEDMKGYYAQDPDTYGPIIIDLLVEGCPTQELYDLCWLYVQGGHSVLGPTLSGSVVSNLSIPEIQTVAAGQSVDPATMVMVGKSTDGQNLAFRNACAYVKVTLTEPCLKVTVTARGGENIVGTVSVDMANAQAPIIACENGKNIVTLKAAEGNLAAGTYYIAVVPSALQYGLSIKYFNPETGLFKASVRETPYTFVRSNVHNGGDNAIALVEGALWEENTIINFWTPYDDAYKEAEKVVINVNVSTGMPAGAKSLGEKGSLWTYYDNAEKAICIETSAPSIWFTTMRDLFDALNVVKSYTGLDNFYVSEVTDFTEVFESNPALVELDLSSWQFSNIKTAYEMFAYTNQLKSLTLNSSFNTLNANIGGLFNRTSFSAHDFTVYGITDQTIKDDIKARGDWNHGAIDYMKFDGE